MSPLAYNPLSSNSVQSSCKHQSPWDLEGKSLAEQVAHLNSILSQQFQDDSPPFNPVSSEELNDDAVPAEVYIDQISYLFTKYLDLDAQYKT